MSQTESVVADKTKGRKPPPAAWVFFKSWLANPLTMGSIVPSSVGLRNLVTKHTVCGPDEIVVEFGGGTRPGITRQPPKMGEHNSEILAETGFTEQEIADLREHSIITEST